MGLGTTVPSALDQRAKEALTKEERALESTQLLNLSSPALTFGFLMGNPFPPISSLNFMLNSVSLVGNEWIKALGNLSISPKLTISIVLPVIQPTLCPSSSVSACETNVRMVIKIESFSDLGSSTSRYFLHSQNSNNFKGGLGSGSDRTQEGGGRGRKLFLSKAQSKSKSDLLTEKQ
jgi:hypothetical protein